MFAIRKLKNKSGYSLTEVIVTLLLVGILGSMIAGLIPVINNVMGTIIVRTRSEMLLNNTVMELRNYLRYAENVREVPESENLYMFTGNDNWDYVISTDDEDNGWITVTPYIKRSSDSEETALGIDSSESNKVHDWHILTSKAGAECLAPTYDTMEYSNGVFRISGLRVVNTLTGETKATYVGQDKAPKTLIIRSIQSR